jgi:hypothetical protein
MRFLLIDIYLVYEIWLIWSLLKGWRTQIPILNMFAAIQDVKDLLHTRQKVLHVEKVTSKGMVVCIEGCKSWEACLSFLKRTKVTQKLYSLIFEDMMPYYSKGNIHTNELIACDSLGNFLQLFVSITDGAKFLVAWPNFEHVFSHHTFSYPSFSYGNYPSPKHFYVGCANSFSSI